MSLIQSVDPDPRSTKYKRHHSNLIKRMERADRHLREDEESAIDPSYEDYLENLLQNAEDLLSQVDDEGDKLEAAREKQRRQEEQISKCLPRTQPQKWDGTINDFMRFKAGAKTLMDNIPDSRMALNAVLDTISDQKLRRSLAKYQTPEEALKSLELQFGNPELSGPKIINDLKGLQRATSTETESAVILKIKEHYTSLIEINQQHLLGLDVLYNLCHKFRERQGEAIMQMLKTEKDPVRLRTMFFERLDDMYTTNTIWSRTNLNNDKKPAEPTKGYTDIRRIDAESEKKKCIFCKGGHFNHQCDKMEEMDLNQVEKLGLCPHCLWGKHDNECPHIEKATFLCKHCKLHYKLKKLHVNCSS